MTVPILVGKLIDRTGDEADVWYYPDEQHIFILIGDSQDGDFPVGQPCKDDPQQVLAQTTYIAWKATGHVAREALIQSQPESEDNDDDAVIEPFETVTKHDTKHVH